MLLLGAIPQAITFAVSKKIDDNAARRHDQEVCAAELQADYNVKSFRAIVAALQRAPDARAALDDASAAADRLDQIAARCYPPPKSDD
jgi:hypothetical protein